MFCIFWMNLYFLFFGIYKNITEIKSKNNKMKNTKMKIKWMFFNEHTTFWKIIKMSVQKFCENSFCLMSFDDFLNCFCIFVFLSDLNKIYKTYKNKKQTYQKRVLKNMKQIIKKSLKQ